MKTLSPTFLGGLFLTVTAHIFGYIPLYQERFLYEKVGQRLRFVNCLSVDWGLMFMPILYTCVLCSYGY